MQNLTRRGMLTAAVSTLLLTTRSEADSWVKLGRRSVRLVADHDVIPVTVLKGDFRKIKLKVRENGIFIDHLVVVYSIGGVDNIPIRYHIGSGGESRVIDLRGGDRFIRSVQLYYRSVRNSKGRSEVTVYGRR